MAPAHGKRSTYINYGCRCDACRQANAVYAALAIQRRSRRPASDVPHGVGGYRNWGCRCEVCTEAQSVACADYRKKAAAAAVAPAPAADETTQP